MSQANTFVSSMQSTTASDTSLLQVTDLVVQYGTVPALNCPRLTVSKGAIVTVIGANGAGKSTLLNAIMGNLPVNGHARSEERRVGKECRSVMSKGTRSKQ